MKKELRDTGRQLVNFLIFSRADLRGINVLCVILLAFILFQFLIPDTTSIDPVDFRPFEEEIKRFEVRWQQAVDEQKRNSAKKKYNRNFNHFTTFSDTGRGVMTGKKNLLVLDLNAADTFDLQQLRGIGPAFARRIVHYRERIRGFSSKDQLLEVFGMDSVRYHWIRDQVKVTRDSIRPFDVNSVTFKELLKHPYFPFALTKQIMIYRQKNKVFHTLEELKSIEGINDSVFRRIITYLRVFP